MLELRKYFQIIKSIHSQSKGQTKYYFKVYTLDLSLNLLYIECREFVHGAMGHQIDPSWCTHDWCNKEGNVLFI